MNKAMILLVALTLYCCIPELHASKLGCRCIKTTPARVPLRTVARVEVTPPSGRCRRTEIVVIRRNSSKVCIKPDADWLPEFLNKLNQDYENITSSTVSPTIF